MGIALDEPDDPGPGFPHPAPNVTALPEMRIIHMLSSDAAAMRGRVYQQ
jgi:hypothetical protein